MRTRASAIRLLVAALLLSPVYALATLLTFDELPRQPVTGLTFNGVAFHFNVGGLNSSDANYASGGPGVGAFVHDPSLEGNAAGVLTLDFDTPTSVLQFGLAMSTLLAVPAGLHVALFDQRLIPLGIQTVDLSRTVTFAEGRFNYAGLPISRAIIDFDEGAASRFALDNLSFGVVPEPGTYVLMFVGLAALALKRVAEGKTRPPQ